jgi:replicative DNA helicase
LTSLMVTCLMSSTLDTDEEYGPQPPQDLAAEQACLGGMLLSETAIIDATAILTAEDFYRPNNAAVFAAIVELVAAGEPVDAITTGALLQSKGVLVRVGGAPYLHTLIEMVPAASNAGFYAKIIAAKARLRRMGELGQRLQQLAYEDSASAEDVDTLIGQGEKFFRTQHRASTKADGFNDLVAAWREDQSREIRAIPTPWKQLNEFLNGGLRRGQLAIVGGRPSEGKSNAGLNMVQHAATWGYSGLVFSVEMPKLEVTARLLAAGAGVRLAHLIQHNLDMDTETKIQKFVDDSNNVKLEVVDEERLTVEQIVSHCRSKKDLDIVFVDYLQLLAPTDSRIDRRLQIAHVSRSLKVAARELDVVMVVAAQLNRGPIDSKTGKMRSPIASDIGESGAVEQDADVVLLLNRDAKDANIVSIVIGKNRNGRKGAIEMRFQGAQARLGA